MKLFLLLIMGISLEARSAVYDNDNRQEVFSAPQSIQNLAKSVLGRFPLDSLTTKGENYEVSSVTLSEKHRSNCSSVKFSEQRIGPNCTGFLVGKNIAITAGHCIKDDFDCSQFYWGFDFLYKKANDQSFLKLAKNNVYRCQKILARKYEHNEGNDYTIFQLDRNVTDRLPLELDFTDKNLQETPIFTLGHPSGLPMKYTNSGIVHTNFEKVFYSNLDTFGGNSGGPVFDENSLKVIGIVSMGNADYVWNSGNSCKIIKVCKNGDKCTPSISSKISQLKNDYELAIKNLSLN